MRDSKGESLSSLRPRPQWELHLRGSARVHTRHLGLFNVVCKHGPRLYKSSTLEPPH